MQIKYPCRVRIVGNSNSHKYTINSIATLIEDFTYTEDINGVNIINECYLADSGYIIRKIDFIPINNKEVFCGNKY